MERRARGGYPPGLTDFNMARTTQMASDPLPILLDCYERFGPVFSVRILHSLNAFLLGPEANHHMLVSNAAQLPLARGWLRRARAAAR